MDSVFSRVRLRESRTDLLTEASDQKDFAVIRTKNVTPWQLYHENQMVANCPEIVDKV
jgi:hypothetical protein